MILFTTSEAAEFLGVCSETLRRREARGAYPKPRRDNNNYRQYTLTDLVRLYRATFGTLDRVAITNLAALLVKRGVEAEEAAKLIGRAAGKE